jgi:hypothetical protein
MDRAIKVIVIVLAVAPWIYVLPMLLLLGLVNAFPQKPGHSRDFATWIEMLAYLRQDAIPIGVGVYCYVLFLIFAFVALRKPA